MRTPWILSESLNLKMSVKFSKLMFCDYLVTALWTSRFISGIYILSVFVSGDRITLFIFELLQEPYQCVPLLCNADGAVMLSLSTLLSKDFLGFLAAR